jgi:hypothetical protein
MHGEYRGVAHEMFTLEKNTIKKFGDISANPQLWAAQMTNL